MGTAAGTCQAARRGEVPRPRAPRAELAAASKGAGGRAKPWKRCQGGGLRDVPEGHSSCAVGGEAESCPGPRLAGLRQTQPWGHLSPEGSSGPQLSVGAELGGSRDEQEGCRAQLGSGREVLAWHSTLQPCLGTGKQGVLKAAAPDWPCSGQCHPCPTPAKLALGTGRGHCSQHKLCQC